MIEVFDCFTGTSQGCYYAACLSALCFGAASGDKKFASALVLIAKEWQESSMLHLDQRSLNNLGDIIKVTPHELRTRLLNCSYILNWSFRMDEDGRVTIIFVNPKGPKA